MTNIAFAAGWLMQAAAVADPRIQVTAYEPERVVNLEIAAGFATMIEFAPHEHVDTVVVGNSAAWQVTTTQSANQLVVKPVLGAAATNMIVVTDARRYVFLLDQGGGGASSPFVLRFDYPQQAHAAIPPNTRVAEFKFRGDKTILPLDMYDDGQRTTVLWDRRTVLPAVFAVRGGHETLVNGRMNGRDYLIEGTADYFVFRAGTIRATAQRRRSRNNRP